MRHSHGRMMAVWGSPVIFVARQPPAALATVGVNVAWLQLAGAVRRLKRTASLLGGIGSVLAVALSADATGNDCPCPAQAAAAAQQSLLEASSVLGEASRLDVRQEQQGSGGLSAQDVAARFGGSRLSEEQRHRGSLLRAAETTLACLDDRISEPALTTPGGELGEFTTALAAYLQEKDGSSGSPPNQEVVDSLLGKYLDTVRCIHQYYYSGGVFRMRFPA
ncbi:hypothetical protein AK812_SmicGene43535 [Symbiodinium microadriaticum]|uniref:Uncharacterized protein n=1 Tax=Symbiodinium microadriaticum TaxID=2951 RepID=A0A1Q9C0S3_SYMMI|nr:hypothetical protein AK812_SmicGene43535 [Symbiodinium microadriaticum]